MRIERVIDLSLPLDAGTQVYPGDPEPRFAVHSTIARDGFNLLSVQMGSQTGTHVDAPYHFDEATLRIDELPLERFVGPGVVVDVRGIGAREPIVWEHIAPVAERLSPASVLLLHTGWSTHYGTDRYFDNPFLDADACRRVLELGVTTFGIDAINIDETPDETHPGIGFPVHHLIAQAGGVICENLTNVAAIDFRDPWISLLPLAFQKADGAPVRAVAMKFSE
ncbi:MAG: cyclase family protein [Rhodoglobus sp.]